MWTGIVNFLIGLWLMAAPSLLGYGGTAAANDRIFGPIAASFAFISIWPVTRGLRWCDFPLGIWLAASPWILGYPRPEAWSTTLAGMAMALVALAPSRAEGEFGGGWSSLWRPGEMPGQAGMRGKLRWKIR